MTERFRPDRLTSKAHDSTLRSERNFMAEQGQGENPKAPQEQPKITPDLQESNKPLTPLPPQPENKIALQDDMQERAKFYVKEQGQDWDKMNVSVRAAWVKYAEEMGRPGPGAMAGGVVPPGAPTPAEAVLRRVENQLTEERVNQFMTDRKARDEYFRGIFELVDATPHEFFQQAFTYENQINLTRFMNIIMNASREALLTPLQREELKADFDRYQLERREREGVHDVNAILYIPSVKAEQLFDSMQRFESVLGDAVFRGPGVVEMGNIYERILRDEMRKNEGYLRPEAITGSVATEKIQKIDPATGAPVVDAAGNPVYDDVVTSVKTGDVERRAKDAFRDYVQRIGVYTRDENGQAVKLEKEFEPWEIDRVFTTARATMIMSGRLLSIAAEGRLGKGLAQYSSLFLQDILQGYSALVHLVGKYGITEEALAAYLHDPDEKIKKVLGLLSVWDPRKYEEAYHEYGKNPQAILESADEFFYLQRQNPNKAGDVFTWQSWRYVENPEEPSAVQDFIAKGRIRMGQRWNNFHAGAPTADVYEEFIHRKEFVVPRNATIKQKASILKARREAWDNAHGGAPSIGDYESYANEYFKWIGSAIRFEKMRGTLVDKLEKPPKGKALETWKAQIKEAREKQKKGKENNLHTLETADRLLQRMVELQPHRLYEISPEIRERINEKLFTFLGFPDEAHQTPAQKAVVDQIIGNFYLLESTMLIERERLLDQGKTFDSHRLSLNEFLRRDDIITDPDPAQQAIQKQQARKFLQFFLEDYRINKGKYLEEFVYRREVRHGYVLWSGDAPLNEYKFSALGPTGSFVRRARDNKANGEALHEEIKILGKLKEINSPDQLVAMLHEVYEKIAGYSADRAKEAIADKAQGFAKFFAERTTTKIPIWGFFERKFGKPSFAKIVYGPTAPAWSSTETRYFFNQLRSKDMISKDQHKKLTEEKVPGSKADTATDIGVTMAQLLAIALFIYLMEKSLRGNK